MILFLQSFNALLKLQTYSHGGFMLTDRIFWKLEVFYHKTCLVEKLKHRILPNTWIKNSSPGMLENLTPSPWQTRKSGPTSAPQNFLNFRNMLSVSICINNIILPGICAKQGTMIYRNRLQSMISIGIDVGMSSVFASRSTAGYLFGIGKVNLNWTSTLEEKELGC